MADKEKKKGRRGNLKIWIFEIWEQKEPFRGNKKHFSQFFKGFLSNMAK